MSSLHVVFKVGEAEYVVPAADVHVMESYTTATRVPGSAPHVLGLIQIRSRVIPVVDLRVRFGLPPVERTLDSRVIVVQHDGREVGLLVDSAREVLRLDAEQFKPPPDVVAERAAGFVSSIAQAGERLMLRLDSSKVIGADGSPEEHSHGENA